MKVEDDFQGFSNAFGTLAEVFEKETSKTLVKIYFVALERYTKEQVIKAIERAIQECKFFPKPVELIEFISGGTSDKAVIEASKVISAVHKVGGYETVIFDDPITMAAIQVGFGGWIQLCEEMKSQDEKWFRKDFEKVYRACTLSQRKFFGYLIGRAEQYNIANGYKSETEPKQIGDPVKIKEILSQPMETKSLGYNGTVLMTPQIKGME